MQSSPYLSTSAQDFQEQARQAANLRYVRGFCSYREAELHGYYSLKRLKGMGLSVPDWMRPYYECAVETRYGNLPVFSRQQATASGVPGLVVSGEEGLSSAKVEILLPEEDTTAPLPGSSSQPEPTEGKKRTRGRARPRSTGYFIDTPEALDIPDSHKDVENEIRLILHVVKAGIDQHRHRVEGWAHYNHPLGKRLMGSPLEQKAYKWLVENDVLICADHSYSHRPDDPKSSFSKSYYVHSGYGKWRKWEITKPKLAAKLLLAQSQRRDLLSPKRQADTELMAKVPAALCGQNCPLPELLTALPQPEQAPMPSVPAVSGQDCQLPGSSTATIPLPEQEPMATVPAALCGQNCPLPELLTITDPIMKHLIRQNLNLGVDWDKAEKILDDHPETDREKALAVARQVGDPQAKYKTCDYGRFHAPITRLFSPLRQAVFFKSHPEAREVGWDLRNSQILHLVKAYKEDRYLARSKSRSQKPFFNERELEFFRLVEKGQVYDFYFAKAQEECPDYLASKIRRTAQKAAWGELWKRYLEGLPLDQRPKDKRQQTAHRRKLLRKRPIRSIAVHIHAPTRDDFKQVLFADVFYGRAVVSTPVTSLFETHHPEIVRWIRQQKARDYADLARRMQQEESGMMIGAVVRRLMEHHPEVPFYTVHDSITTVEEWGDLVGRVLREEYQRAGLHPTLKETGDET